MDKNFLSSQIGERLRFYRKQRQLSLEELAELTDVSKPMLGQIERGASNPTVASLWKIASGLQIPFASFLIKDPSIKLVKKEDQPFFKEDDDLFETYNTFASPGIPLEIFRIRMLPGCKHHSSPAGIGVLKSITVHSGILTLNIGENNEHTLKKGDAISFSSDVGQIFQNVHTDVCELSMSIYYSGPQLQS